MEDIWIEFDTYASYTILRRFFDTLGTSLQGVKTHQAKTEEDNGCELDTINNNVCDESLDVPRTIVLTEYYRKKLVFKSKIHRVIEGTDLEDRQHFQQPMHCRLRLWSEYGNGF